MSRAYLHCQCCVQRLRRVAQAASRPGSRTSDPWTLRSKRGFPQLTPKMQRILIVQAFGLAGMGCGRPGLTALVRRRPGCDERGLCGPKSLRLAHLFRAYVRILPYPTAVGLKPERTIPLRLFTLAGRCIM